MRSWNHIRTLLHSRFLRFCVVGGVGSVVDVGVCYFLTDKVGISLTFSKLISYECGIVNNYLLNAL